MTKASVLIVEDDRRVGFELQDYLTTLGFSVPEISFSASSGVERAAELRPDLVLMDARLGGAIDGIAAADLIQSRYDIPVVYVVSNPQQTTLRRSKATGPFGYIFRPLERGQILATVEVALLRKQLEKQLKESRRWLATVLNSMGAGVIVMDESGLISAANPVAEALTGWTEAEALKKPWQEVLALVHEPAGALAEPSPSERILRADNRVPLSVHALLRARTGTVTPIEITLTSILGTEAAGWGRVLVLRDETSRLQTMEQLKQHAERAEILSRVAQQLNSHLELTELLVTVCNITNQALKTSVSVVLMFSTKEKAFKPVAWKTEPDSFPGNSARHDFSMDRTAMRRLLPTDNSPLVLSSLPEDADLPHDRLLRQLGLSRLALAPLRQGENIIGALICGSLRNDRDFTPDDLLLLGSLADHLLIAISNATMFEQVRISRERQRRLSRNLVDVQEAERRRLARELHDDLGQTLTGLQFMVESTKIHATDAQISFLNEMQRSIGDLIEQVRELSLSLRPSMLDDFGLVPALQWHLHRYSAQTGIQVDFHADESEQRVRPEIETAAYRIIQEGLTNVARHAQVKQASVRVERRAGMLCLYIHDEGRGLDPAAVLERPTSGLGGMQERASLAGGRLVIRSERGKGTRILAVLPLGGAPLERRKHERDSHSG